MFILIDFSALLVYYVCTARVAELVDAIDSKSIDGNIMRVRFSPRAHKFYAKIRKKSS
jgi:hypothetical protein